MTITFANGASLSDTQRLNGQVPVAVRISSATWTAAAITFVVNGAGLRMMDDAGEYSVTPLVGQMIPIEAGLFIGADTLQLRSGNSLSPVSQGQAVTVELACISQPVGLVAGGGSTTVTNMPTLSQGDGASDATTTRVVMANDKTVAIKAAVSQFVDGSMVTIGAKADLPATSDAASATEMALLKRQLQHQTALLSAGPELMTNTGFESAGAGPPVKLGWVDTVGDGAIADEATLFHTGAHGLKLTAGVTMLTYTGQTFSVTPGGVYNLSFWTMGDGTYGGRYFVTDATNSINIVNSTDTLVPGATYTQVFCQFIAPVRCTSVTVYLFCPAHNGGIAYYDDISCTQVQISIAPGANAIGKVVTPTFSQSDSLVRPANATPYTAQQSINCNCAVTALVSIVGNTVTLTAANAFALGDRITVAGVDGNFTGATNINGNWICIAGTNATTVVFVTALTPTGTPAVSSHGTIAKCLSVGVADAVGNGILLSRISVALPGIAMTGAVRCYIYTVQPTVLVDHATFTLLAANDTARRDYFDLYPVTEANGSDVTFASAIPNEIFKCDPADTRLYFRLVTEAAGTPASAGTVTIEVSGTQLLG